MKSLTRWLMTLVLATFATGSLVQAQKGSSVAGKWDMNVKGPAAHGDLAATIDLEQNGEKVTGRFAAHGNEHTVAGTFADGTLTLETTDTPADKGLSFTAQLQSDGTLSGYISGPMGDMKWTAARARGSR